MALQDHIKDGLSMFDKHKEKLFALVFVAVYLAVSTADYNDAKMMEDYKASYFQE